jgi:hypothetical protein
MSQGTDDPADALSALGDETRLAILRALAEADGALSFSELRRRVGVRDTGRFNYHLAKLREHFVRESEAGYELGPAGTRVIAAAGAPVGADGTDPDAVAGEDCPVCGESDCDRLIHVHLATPW